jgi:hypothetical protein
MSENAKTLIESLLMIGAMSGGLVWYAVAAGRRESRDAQSPAKSAPAQKQDPDAHLGRCGTE